MRFKDQRQEQLFKSRAHPILESVVSIIDSTVRMLSIIHNANGNDEQHGYDPYPRDITITSFWREQKEGKKSFHPKFQAVDIRSKGLSQRVKLAIFTILLQLKKECGKIQYVYETCDVENEHIHIEIDTGDPE